LFWVSLWENRRRRGGQEEEVGNWPLKTCLRKGRDDPDPNEKNKG